MSKISLPDFFKLLRRKQRQPARGHRASGIDDA